MNIPKYIIIKSTKLTLSLYRYVGNTAYYKSINGKVHILITWEDEKVLTQSCLEGDISLEDIYPIKELTFRESADYFDVTLPIQIANKSDRQTPAKVLNELNFGEKVYVTDGERAWEETVIDAFFGTDSCKANYCWIHTDNQCSQGKVENLGLGHHWPILIKGSHGYSTSETFEAREGVIWKAYLCKNDLLTDYPLVKFQEINPKVYDWNPFPKLDLVDNLSYYEVHRNN